ncbi:hypothetical protein BKA69DRAFT_1141680, partial [Paraphysoderma sedebokerense]
GPAVSFPRKFFRFNPLRFSALHKKNKTYYSVLYLFAMPGKQRLRDAFAALSHMNIPFRRPTASIHTLPEEVLELIFQNLIPIQLIPCALVCKKFYRISYPCFFRHLYFSRNVLSNFNQAYGNMSKSKYISVRYLQITPPQSSVVVSPDQYQLVKHLHDKEFIFRNLRSLKINIESSAISERSLDVFKLHVTAMLCMALFSPSIDEIDISSVNLYELEDLLQKRLSNSTSTYTNSITAGFDESLNVSSRLKTLKLKETFISEEHLLSSSLFSRFCLQHLKVLKINWKANNSLTFQIWSALISSCRALQELKFKNLNFDRVTFDFAVKSAFDVANLLPQLANLTFLKLSYPTYSPDLDKYTDYCRMMQRSLPNLSKLTLKGVGRLYPCFQCFVPNLQEICLHNVTHQDNNPDFLKCLVEVGTRLKTLVCKGVCDETDEEFKDFLKQLCKTSLKQLVFDTNSLIGWLVSGILIEKSRGSANSIRQIDLLRSHKSCLSMLRDDLLPTLFVKKDVDWPMIRFIGVRYDSDTYKAITKCLKRKPYMKKIIRYTVIY